MVVRCWQKSIDPVENTLAQEPPGNLSEKIRFCGACQQGGNTPATLRIKKPSRYVFYLYRERRKCLHNRRRSYDRRLLFSKLLRVSSPYQDVQSFICKDLYTVWAVLRVGSGVNVPRKRILPTLFNIGSRRSDADETRPLAGGFSVCDEFTLRLCHCFGRT